MHSSTLALRPQRKPVSKRSRRERAITLEHGQNDEDLKTVQARRANSSITMSIFTPRCEQQEAAGAEQSGWIDVARATTSAVPAGSTEIGVFGADFRGAA